jgi:hypothetical protein
MQYSDYAYPNVAPAFAWVTMEAVGGVELHEEWVSYGFFVFTSFG